METDSGSHGSSRIIRPKVFIGSSSEGKEYAHAARGLLEPDVEVTLWDEDFADLGRTVIETLTDAAPHFDLGAGLL
jgi:hypothetical protein